MTVPGVNVIVAASFMATIGDIDRFESPRKLVGYLGLDPRVYQSGLGPASHGRISKKGSVRARHALVEACWSAVRQPGPLHAFYERIRARRGHNVAVVAAARKLACLFWCLLTREEDYAYSQPSLTRKKLRRLRSRPVRSAARPRPPASGKPTRLSVRPSASSPTKPRWHMREPCATGTQPRRGRRARARHRGAHQISPRRAKPRGRQQAPDVCASARRHPRPPEPYRD